MTYFYKCNYLIAGVFCTLSQLWANTLPESNAVNGGLTIIPVSAPQKPDAYFNDKRVAVAASAESNQWLLLIGIPLDSTQAIQQVEITHPTKGAIPFYVSDKYYRTQYLTIKDERKVEPLVDDQRRIDDETKKLAALFAAYSNNDPFSTAFKPPTYGAVSSQFGLKRVYNKEPRPPHLGLDIAAPADAPVLAVNAGKVVEAADYFFTGNTVIVDHGMGVFSLYGHLKQMDVKTGDMIKQGDQVGLVGMTGRATGPHLHWSMVMNQTMINPLLFVSERKITTLPTVPKPAEPVPAVGEKSAAPANL